MTSAQRDAIPMDTSPVGLVIFNTDTNALQYLFEETLLPMQKENNAKFYAGKAQPMTAFPFTQPTKPSTGQLYYDQMEAYCTFGMGTNGSPWEALMQ